MRRRVIILIVTAGPESVAGGQGPEGEPGPGPRLPCPRPTSRHREAVLEFVNTEGSYGEDLRVIRQEFYLPMQDAGLLAREQLAVIFSNIQELIEVNEKFTQRLHDSTEQSIDFILNYNNNPCI
uniref:DH domain-containing protein n=1 Tax=Callorhinchus milii TaxID=7868 RepID=A0A4W3JC18_CALMI